MSRTPWKHLFVGVSLFGAATSIVLAQDSAIAAPSAAVDNHWSHRTPGGSFAATLDTTLGLTPEQRDSVRGILSDQHQQSRDLREKTDGKIRAILTPDQQKKFDELLSKQKSQRFRKAS